ncbi:MAG: metallophosphoesterase [Deltaproteobacteria bacterium]|nr:metallophosphoesterase [Deltaproteobacteria bacterium]
MNHTFIVRARTALSVILCLGLFIAVSGASSCSNNSTTVELTILHTNDVHSHMRAEPVNSEKNPYNLGGLARVKTLADSIRGARPNTLLLDAGDWSEAITYFNVDGGSNMLKIMDAMGYSAVVVGNHDFLNGPSELASTIERANPSYPVLGANKDLSQVADKERVAKLLTDYKIFNVGGVKVAVVGLLCNDFFYYGYFKPGIVTDARAVATAITTNLHNKKLADVIILLSHNSFGQNVSWAQQVPWVNAVISGHSHAKTPQAIVTSNGGRPAYVAESKQWGQFLGDMVLSYDTSSGQTTLKSYTLRPVTADLAEDPKIVGLINDQETALAAKYGKDIVHDHVADTEDLLVHNDNREGPISNLAVDGYRQATGADLAMESVQLIGDDIQPGPLSTFNVMNMTPHIYHPVPGQPFPQNGSNWTLKKLTLSGTSLRGLLNVMFLAESVNLIGWISTSGMQVVYDPSGGASAVHSIKIQNMITGAYEDVVDSRDYKIALHDGLLMAVGILVQKLSINIDLSRIEETGIQSSDATLALVAAKGGMIRAADFNPGTRYNALGVDLGFYEHHIRIQPGTGTAAPMVSVTIQNEGLTASTAGMMKLRILRGKPDDVQGDFMPGNESIPISGDVDVPALQPGASTTLQVPWLDLPAGGIYSLNFSLIGTDSNARNNSLIMHTRMAARH